MDMSNWLEAGGALYRQSIADPRLFPPLGERQAQRWWLGGFAAAWAEGCDERPIDLGLASALGGRAELLGEPRGGAKPTPGGIKGVGRANAKTRSQEELADAHAADLG
jgi:hypothetical protein